MEVRNNLLANERQKAARHFDSQDFKKVAMVVMGEPPQAFKDKVHSDILAEKKEQAVREVKRKKVDSDRQKGKKEEEILKPGLVEDGAEAEKEETLEDLVKKAEESTV